MIDIEKVKDDVSNIISELKEYVKAQKKKRTGAIDREIYYSSILLKNIAISQANNSFSADYIFEILLENSKGLKTVYADMISKYRTGKEDEAFEFFAKQCGTVTARKFSMILSKLDKINPSELVEQMNVFQEMLMQTRMTEDLKVVERNSMVTLLMATGVVLGLIIDFLVVVIFMNTLNNLTLIF